MTLSALIATGFVVCWSSGFIGGRLAIDVALPALDLYVWRFALATLLAAACVGRARCRSVAC